MLQCWCVSRMHPPSCRGQPPLLTDTGSAQHRSMMHNVVLCPRVGAQRRSHKPRTDRRTDRTNSITLIADVEGNNTIYDIKKDFMLWLITTLADGVVNYAVDKYCGYYRVREIHFSLARHIVRQTFSPLPGIMNYCRTFDFKIIPIYPH